MPVVTWKNIAPDNQAGLLNAANQAAKTMGEGFAGVGTALQGGVDKKVESETNDFISDLMAAGSQEERDAMIGAANDSFLNMKNVNATNYELGAPDRAAEVFKTNLQLEEESAMRLDTNRTANEFLLKQRIEDEINIPAALLDAQNTADLAYQKKWKPVDDPISGGYLAELYGKDGKLDSGFNFGRGGGYDKADQEQLNKYRQDFLSKYNVGDYKTTGKNITMDDFNRFIVEGGITFRDDILKDEFLFNYKGEYSIGIDDSGSMDKLYNAILESKNKSSTEDILDSEAWKAFQVNNKDSFPEGYFSEGSNLDEALRIFNKVGSTSKTLTIKEVADARATVASEFASILQGENQATSSGEAESSPALIKQASRLIKEADFTDATAKAFIEQLLTAKKEGLGIQPFQDEMLTQLLKTYAK